MHMTTQISQLHTEFTVIDNTMFLWVSDLKFFTMTYVLNQ